MGDPLTAVLASLRIAGSIACSSRFTAPWGFSMPARPGAIFHSVGRGSCWVIPGPGGAPVHLEQGDFILFPRGQAHVLADEPGRTAQSVECRGSRMYLAKPPAGGNGPLTEFLCGEFSVDSGGEHPLWAQMPDFVHLRSHSSRESFPYGLRSTLRLLAVEAKHRRLGGELVVRRLLDVVLVQVVRTWLASHEPVSTGWLRGMRDRKVGAALGLLHDEPERDWTVASLAKAVGTSRTVFAQKFVECVGEGPIAYLTRIRMQRAANLLRQNAERPMISVAETVGYGSEAAFGRAFKRITGVTPGNYRREGRDTAG